MLHKIKNSNKLIAFKSKNEYLLSFDFLNQQLLNYIENEIPILSKNRKISDVAKEPNHFLKTYFSESIYRQDEKLSKKLKEKRKNMKTKFEKKITKFCTKKKRRLNWKTKNKLKQFWKLSKK